jgi:hypothetical protein
MHAPQERRRASSDASRHRLLSRVPRSSAGGWQAAVAVSGVIFVLVVLIGGIAWIASHHSRDSTYSVAGQVRRLALRIASGDAVIVGNASSTVEVRRSDSYSFGRSARERRTFANGELTVTSRCPRILMGSCSASYEVAVPETVPVDIRTTTGSVRLEGFRGSASVRTGSGDVDVQAYCGFALAATSGSGDLHVSAACAPQTLRLHTRSGNAVALVPPGRYRIDAAGRSRQVRGVTADPRAPFSLELTSTSGGVRVGGGL